MLILPCYSRVRNRRKKVSNMPMFYVKCVWKVTRLECQLFNDHFQICYSMQDSPSMYTAIIVHDFPHTLSASIGSFDSLFFYKVYCTLGMMSKFMSLQSFYIFWSRFHLSGHKGSGNMDVAVSLVNKARCYKHVAALSKHNFRYMHVGGSTSYYSSCSTHVL